MKTRVISGAVVFAVTAALFYLGGAVIFAAFGILSIIGLTELYRVFGLEKKPVAAAAYIMTAVYYTGLYLRGASVLIPCLVLLMLVVLVIYVVRYPGYHIDDIARAFTGFVYVPVMLGFVCLVRAGNNGAFYVWLILLSSWGCDTMAYFTGVLFGKHKMTPVLSPKKTWEGAAGGVAGAALFSFLFALIFKNSLGEGLGFCLVCMFAAVPAAVISMIGDLAASGIKRNYGIKDYGTLIPGHGGILDRFDSMLFTAPVISFALDLLLHIRHAV